MEWERAGGPCVLGETAAPQYKPATLETGAGVKVPAFVAAGDRIVVNTKTGDFVRRAK